MGRRGDPRIEWDPQDGIFRATFPVRRADPPEARPAVAVDTISSLLAKSFGQPLRSGATIPVHLQKYVKKT